MHCQRFFIAVAWLLVGLILALAARADEKPSKAPPKTFMGMPLLFADDFESGKADFWEPTDANAWRVTHQGDNHVYNQFAASKYEPPVRSPFNRSLIKDHHVGDFVFEVRVQSTGRDNPHRDLCLFFGFQDPAHLYYVHLGKRADEHANSIFLVDNAARVSIAQQRTDGTAWDDQWHLVRIVRHVERGEILIYFDDMEKPAMKTSDRHFTSGRVGLGSFDDSGNFDDVRLWGIKVEPRIQSQG